MLAKRTCCDDATTFEWSLQNADGMPAFGVISGESVAWTNGPPYTLDAWTLLVGVYDGTMVTLYVDGEVVSNATATAPTAERAIGLTLGSREDPSGFADPWAGAIDEARLWRRALSADEVSMLYAE